MDDPAILLTNDDGFDATGIRVLRDALSSIGSVTVVAPAEDQSAVGRTRSESVTIEEYEGAYIVDGTPVDCVIAGLHSLAPETDLVVAGCNQGANLGSAVLGRSGTVSAAVEAAFFDVPAIAVSMYITEDLFDDGNPDLAPSRYAAAVDAATYLVEHASETGVFEHADYLNVNAPLASRSTGEMVVTRPADRYRMNADRDGDTITLYDSIWEAMDAGWTDDPPGTDRHAILEGDISVSPLSAPHTTAHDPAFATLADDYNGDER